MKTPYLMLPLLAVLAAAPAVAQVPDGSLRTEAMAPDVDFSFQSADGLKLKAKLTLPADTKGPVPVVVFIGGSGAWDSDYVATQPTTGKSLELMPIRDLAQRCAMSGLAFVRCQKRGVSDPGGIPNADWKSMQLHNLLSDAERIVAKVKADSRLDGHRIAMVGHSEGTEISTWVGGHDPDVKAFGLLGIARRNLHELMHFQLVENPVKVSFTVFDLNKDGVFDATEIAQAVAKGGRFTGWQTLDTDHDARLSVSELSAAMEANFAEFDHAVATGKTDDMVLNKPAGWWKEHFAHESPGDTWKSISTPVLVLQGKADTNTPYETEAVAFEAQMAKQHHPDHRLVGFDGLDHRFEDASGRSHAADAFAKLVPWLSSHLRVKENGKI